jgi:hypothetical protein
MTKVKPLLIILLGSVIVSAVSAGAAAAQAVSANASADKKSIVIGDDVNYRLEYRFPAGYAYAPPDFGNVLSGFEVRNRSEKKSVRRAGYKFTLTSYTTGEAVIGSFDTEFVAPSGAREKAQAPAVTVSVRFPDISGNAYGSLRDIKPPLVPPYPAWVYVLVLLAAAAAAYFVYSLKRKPAATEAVRPGPPPPAPEETANCRLNELSAKNLPERGLIKEYYVELSGIIRLYLSEKYGVPVIERTTEELSGDLKKLVSKKRNVEIRGFLESCDMVKFAKYSPGLNETRGDFDFARELVNTRVEPR